jgi:hypothetical protein
MTLKGANSCDNKHNQHYIGVHRLMRSIVRQQEYLSQYNPFDSS